MAKPSRKVLNLIGNPVSEISDVDQTAGKDEANEAASQKQLLDRDTAQDKCKFNSRLFTKDKAGPGKACSGKGCCSRMGPVLNWCESKVTAERRF